MADAFARFEAAWLAQLNNGARTTFRYAPLANGTGIHSAIADAFATSLGYKGIGFNWELLDAAGGADTPRSAIGEITQALAKDISNPSQDWLDYEQARRCAGELLECFDQATLTVVSNRYDGLWNPIAGAATEWGFVCFDDTNIALLLIAEL